MTIPVAIDGLGRHGDECGSGKRLPVLTAHTARQRP
ncbi:hypothetical protein SAURM35S_03084 [Streptomyces aurantiogriseus]